MSTAAASAEITATARSAELLGGHRRAIAARTDRLFANLMLVQWVAGICAALWLSPRAWAGAQSQPHLHVWAAILLGGGIASLPVFLAWRRPGETITRHVIAVAQMLFSALLIDLTGGRLETHFHVFGSLAFLAIYRDWRVLATATAVTALDHFARGAFLPQSVFGVPAVNPWRWLEHAGWVLFEDAFLCISIRQAGREMAEIATHRAGLEQINVDIEHQVRERTHALGQALQLLKSSELRYRTLSACAPIGIFEADREGHTHYTNARWQEISGLTFEQSLGYGWRDALHPEDRQAAYREWKRCVAAETPYEREYRYRRPDGEVRWVHVRSVAVRSESGEIACHIGAVEDVTDRRRAEDELARMTRDLLDASRQAGKAEMATAVLHNVGNVLNSVNVASRCLAESLRKSKVGSLARVAAMLHDNVGDLGHFFTVNPHGREVTGFLSQLAQQLTAEQTKAMTELEQLQKNIEHIKEIVAVQQTYAKVTGVPEEVQLADLVEDTLRINGAGSADRAVEVVREFSEVPSVAIEKHKVLQILVNLVANAKQSCGAVERDDRRVTLRIFQEEQSVKVSVADNGVGIPRENLERIFNHGFTTKPTGHGFGLHSSALAAREMGGALHVASAGPGQGATFTLELPAAAIPLHAS